MKIVKRISKLPKKWKLINSKLERNFIFRNFRQAVKFVNRVADLAEEENHHPDILIYSWNKVKLTLFTHDISGLSEKDIGLAEKINKIK